jgi:hypothetical protein
LADPDIRISRRLRHCYGRGDEQKEDCRQKTKTVGFVIDYGVHDESLNAEFNVHTLLQGQCPCRERLKMVWARTMGVCATYDEFRGRIFSQLRGILRLSD